jgi:hypothetical protein
MGLPVESLFTLNYREAKKSSSMKLRYIKVKVEHYLLFMFSPPKISWVVSGIKYICLHLLPVFYLIQPSSKQIICFDFRKQNSVLPIVFYVPRALSPSFFCLIIELRIDRENTHSTNAVRSYQVFLHYSK